MYIFYKENEKVVKLSWFSFTQFFVPSFLKHDFYMRIFAFNSGATARPKCLDATFPVGWDTQSVLPLPRSSSALEARAWAKTQLWTGHCRLARYGIYTGLLRSRLHCSYHCRFSLLCPLVDLEHSGYPLKWPSMGRHQPRVSSLRGLWQVQQKVSVKAITSPFSFTKQKQIWVGTNH